MSVVLVAIVLLWLSAVGVWPLLTALLACSTVWAGGGTEAEMIVAGVLAWIAVALVRRRLRARRYG
ncbi:MAG: hypothetical protein BroJett022_14110 [Actinomycetes bacterium]|nr:MAG: hypothetical protein BroJett022_14110 [Actinomycetes bacterium]